MLSRALILATVAFVLGWIGSVPAEAQNLEAGKQPSQIFSSTCSLCHKSPRGLLRSVAPGSLPGFLRQHYTTSTDMAAAMSAYVLSNGAASAPAAGNLTRQGQETRGGLRPPPGAAEAEPPVRGRRQPPREAVRPDADGLQEPPPATAAERAAERQKNARQKAVRNKGAKGVPPKDDARHEMTPKEESAPADAAKSDSAKPEPSKPESSPSEPPKTEAAKPDADKPPVAKDDDKAAAPKPDTAKPEPSASEPAKTAPAKSEGTRSDPVPAVTPAPKEAAHPDAPPVVAAPVPAPAPVDDSSRPLTIDISPSLVPTAPKASDAPTGAGTAPVSK